LAVAIKTGGVYIRALIAFSYPAGYQYAEKQSDRKNIFKTVSVHA
jgi:hypothetical protein